MGGSPIVPTILDYLQARPGEPVTLQRMATETGVPAVKLQKALSNLLKDGGYDDAIQTVHRGQAWRWLAGNGQTAQAPPVPVAVAPRARQAPPPPPPQGLAVGDVVEVMGLTQEGHAVARDGDGKLFRVTPL